MKVCLVNGRDSPELFVAEDPRMGTILTADKMAFKVRFEFGAAIANGRPFGGM